MPKPMKKIADAILQIVAVWALAVLCAGGYILFSEAISHIEFLPFLSVVFPFILTVTLAFGAGYLGFAWFNRICLWISWVSVIITAVLLQAFTNRSNTPTFIMMTIAFLSTLAVTMRSGIKYRSERGTFVLLLPLAWILLMLILMAIVMMFTFDFPAPG